MCSREAICLSNLVYLLTNHFVLSMIFSKLSNAYRHSQRRQCQPTPVLLPGKSHGQGSLVAAVHGVVKSRTRLSDFTFTFHCHATEKEMAAHSSILAWRISGMAEPGGLPSKGVAQSWKQLKRLSSSSTGIAIQLHFSCNYNSPIFFRSNS